MSKLEQSWIDTAIEVDGFDYAMVHADDWKQIQDPHFQQLLANFLAARIELAQYIKQDLSLI